VFPRPGFFYHYLLCANGPAFSVRNVLVRMTVTTVYTAVITAIACLIPFFGCGCPPGQLQVRCLLVRSAPWCVVRTRSSSSSFGQRQVPRTSFLGKLPLTAKGLFAAAVLQAAPVPQLPCAEQALTDCRDFVAFIGAIGCAALLRCYSATFCV
jgi:hypothetical protein